MFARTLSVACLSAVLSLPMLSAASAQATMKLASATINDVQHEWQKVFVEELAKRAGDSIKTEIFPASQLGAIPRMAEGVLLGSIEAFTTPTSFMTNVDPRFQAFDVPGLFRTPQDVKNAIHDPEYRDHLETLFLDKGLRVIGAIYNSPTVLFTRKEAKELKDIKGLKLRTFASPLQIKPMEAVGATPVPLPLTEVIPQLESGGIDGLLVGTPVLTAFKYYDVGKNILDLSFAEIVTVTVVNEDWFQSQSAEAQEAIRAAGRAAEEGVFEWGVQTVQKANQTWLDNGGVIHALSDAEKASMQEDFAKIGAEIVAQDPAVEAEYLRLRELVAAKSAQ